MSISSIGSGFSSSMPTITLPPVTVAPRIVEATKASSESNTNAGSGGGDRPFPAKLASTESRETMQKSPLGALIVAQEDARSRPQLGSQAAAAAYRGE